MERANEIETIIAICNDCGRRYKVSISAIGRQVKCKACGQQFTVINPKPAVRSSDNAISRDTPNKIRALAVDQPMLSSKRVIQNSATQQRIQLFAKYLLFIQPNGLMLLALLAFAIFTGYAAGKFVALFTWSMMGFPILAGLCLISGVSGALISAIVSPEEFKAPWSVFARRILSTGILGAIIGRIIFGAHRRRIDDEDFGLFFHRVLPLTLKCIALAALSVVMLLVASATDSLPRNAPTSLDLQAKALLAKRPTGHMHEIPNPPPRVDDQP